MWRRTRVIIEGKLERRNTRVVDILYTGSVDVTFIRTPCTFSIAVLMVIFELYVDTKKDPLYISDWTCQVEVLPRELIAESEFRSR